MNMKFLRKLKKADGLTALLYRFVMRQQCGGQPARRPGGASAAHALHYHEL